ncbi:MAG: hypothetical protein ACPGRX_06080 [Bdellovibrionales bacterium]
MLAVVLIGALSAAIMSSGGEESSNIDRETLALRASEVQRYASELERAVNFVMQNGVSESDIRFAHPDAHADYGDLSSDTDQSDQVFARDGGGAGYRAPPNGVNDGSAWEFYGGTHIPGMGRSDRAELVAVLPHVTQAFCDKINALNGQNGTPADDGGSAASGSLPGDCVQMGALGRFDDSRQFYSSVNTMDETSGSFDQDAGTSAARPAPEACVVCSVDTNAANGTDDERHYYHVLMTR